MTLASGLTSSSQLWYVTRATGVVAFVLLTVTFALGLVATQRVQESRYWPRFATQHLHRNVSLIALGFILVHVLTTLVDTYVTVGWWSLVVPFASRYRTLGVTLGTLSLDVILLLIATSLVRDRIPLRAWRAVHWTAYAMWPLAFGHFVLTGTDGRGGGWGLYLALASAVLLAVATAARWLTGAGHNRHPVATRGIGVSASAHR